MLTKFNRNLNLRFTNLVKYVLNKTRHYADEATIPVCPPELYNFDKSKFPTEVKVTKQEALQLYENMVLIRRMETEAANLYKAKKIFGFCHLYVGTEAVGTGVVAAMKPADDLITSYRCHAFAMMFLRQDGKDGPRLVLSELAGRAEGVMGGKGGSMHLYVPPYFYGGQAIVGGQVPLGVGLGFGHMYSDDGGVCFALYGDGAANQGQVFEAFNIASLLKVPVVFVCENNQYGMGTAASRSSASTEYYRAGRYLPGIKTDGMDVITVREIAKVASEYSRSGAGPVILEMDTYRYFGHSMSDPGVSYRSREEPPELYNFDKSKFPTEVKVTKQEALQLYENMVLIRRMETEAANLYKAKKIFGFCHLYVGTEAVGTGVVAAMKPADDLITSYRCHAFAMMFLRQDGKDGPRLVLSELAGRAEGVMGGKGGSMHLYVPPYFYGGQAIVGGQVPLGVGLGFGHMYSDDGGVCFALYGDGAANQGQVFEAFNIASLLKVPVVFVCENNQYGMGTAASRSSASTEYYRAGRYLPGIKTDGMDVITVREIAKVASEYSRSGAGPVILEMDTYRYFGHSMSDPGVSYRSREEVQRVRETRDPIGRLRKLLVEHGLADEKELDVINKTAKKACVEARKAAEAGALPDPKEVYTHLYVKYLEQPRQCTCVG